MKTSLSFLLLSALLLPVAAYGQARGTISGYAKDSTGAVLPNVKITITNEQTAARREATTGGEGFYQVLALTSGVYTVEAELGSFKKYRNTGVELTLDQNLRVDIQMEVGQITESVQVTSQAAVVDTRQSNLSALVDDRRIVDLPLSGRNVIALASLLPGVTQVSAPSNSDITDARAGARMTVNGSRANQFYGTLNGTYFNNPSRNTGLNVPPPDAVQEFRIQTSNFSAESGRNAGAIVSVVTRAGGNNLHGAVWEFHRSSALNARSFFQAAKPKEHQNQFGATTGGPVKKDKVFFFAAYEGIRDRRAASEVSAFPPTAVERSGDFSALSKRLVNPFTGNTPFPNNQIPSSLFDPVSLNLLKFVPAPPPGGRLASVAPAPRNATLFMARNDWTLTSKQTLFAHYYLNQNELKAEGLQYGTSVPGWMGRSQRVRVQNAGLTHTYVLSPRLLNQLILGYTRSVSLDLPSATRRNAELGIAGMPDYTDGGATQFRISGRFDLRAGGPVKFTSNNYDINDSLSWTRGRHTMKVGFQYLKLAFFQSFLGPPSFTFNGTRTGDPFADFLMGAYRNLSVGFGVRVNDGLTSFTSAFYQDDWKISPRLTLNFGMRYEMPKPWIDRADRINTVDPRAGVQSKVVPNAPPGMLFVGDLPRGLVVTDKNNFAPRLGFAWDVFGDGKTAVRGAYGMFYDQLNADSVAQENPPFAGTMLFVNGRVASPLVGQTAPPVYPDAKNFKFVYPLSNFFIDLSLRTPYIQQWNFTIERQLGKNLSVQAAYVGNTARKLAAYRPFNVAVFKPGTDANGKPLSTLENVNDRVPFNPRIYGPQMIALAGAFNSHHESGQLRVDKRFSNNFSVLGSYTYGKTLDFASTATLGGCVANPYDLNSDRGRAQFDSRHTLAVSWLWTPLSARGSAVRRILGGWNLSGIHRGRSGYPFTVYTGDDTVMGGDICGGGELHPDLVGQPSRSHSSRQDMLTKFFNKDAFRVPQPGYYGSAGRNLISGPGFASSDFALLKEVPVWREQKAQFRAEFFNAFNQVNFSGIRANLTDSRVGQISGAGSGRTIQFGLKYLW